MKKLGISLLSVFALAGAAFGYLSIRKPHAVPPEAVKVEMTPERIARGKYIFQNLADCGGCHSERDWSKFAAPVLAGRDGVGGAFPKELGLPGHVVAPNITPDPETGIGSWSDGEKIRAIRDGVSRDGRALFSMMPYQQYREMSDEDVHSLVAYLNSIPPVKNQLPKTDLDFPVNLLIKGDPSPAGHVAQPSTSNPVKYGEYLAKIGGCIDCHTQLERGALNKSLLYAGGREFKIGPYVTNSANITPDETSGIGNWTEQKFISKFHGYQSFATGTPPKATQANFTLMPWVTFSQLPESDLKAIYAYLRTQKAIYNPVDSHPALASAQ